MNKATSEAHHTLYQRHSALFAQDTAQLYEQAVTLIFPAKNGTAKAHTLEGVLVECVYV
jgi:hypothetical protein